MTFEAKHIQADFDRIALLPDSSWDHNNHYHPFLIRQLPHGCQTALEIGCGTGQFSRLLAQSCRQVLAIDLSPQMILIARKRSAGFSNIDFRVTDMMTLDSTQRFDFIVAIATLHHLPVTETLLRMKSLLNDGGRLLVLDLFRSDLPTEFVFNAIAMPMSVSLRLMREGRLRPPREVRDAWKAHERHDSFLTMAEVRKLYQSVLPGAIVRRHLFWRYSMVWTKDL